MLLARRYSARRNPGSDLCKAIAPARSPDLLLDATVEKYYDLIMVLVLVGTTIFGFWKGMAWQLASLASLIVSYFGALRFSEQLAPVIKLDPPLNRFAAMLLIYMFSSFIIWMLFRLVAGAIDKVRLESFDRQLGAIFGFAKGVLLCVVITFFAVTFLPPAQGEAIVASQSGRYIVALLDKSHSVFPPEIQQIVGPYLEKVEQRLNPGHPSHAGLQTNFPQPQGTQPAQPAAAWPPMNMSIPESIKSQLPQIQWPPTGGTQTSPPAEYNPYSAPREPNPFPTPYSAGVPGGRGY
jgi:membrane protein required for colicin V production